MQFSSCTAVFASASLLLAGAAFGQNVSSAVNSQTANFYVTTPQTGEQVAVGEPQQAASPQRQPRAGGALAAPSAGGMVANTYLSQTQMTAVRAAGQSSKESTRATRNSQRHASSRQSHGTQTSPAGQSYSVQQVSNPAGALGSAQVSAATHSSSRGAAAGNSAAVVSTSVQPNYYTNTAQPAAAAQATATPKKGLFSRLVHSHPKTQATGQDQQTVNDWGKYKPSRLAHTMQKGMASWYGKDFHGGKTANGERYDMNSMTAAHKTLPFGTMVKVRNERNGRECVVRINNRGPFSKGRILDLSKAAASHLGMVSSGVARVTCEVVGRS